MRKIDEEQKNTGQDIAEKAVDTAKDTKAAVKDGASLAKNAATGNVVGAVKDGFKLLGNKTVRKALLISILVPIIVVVALASSIFSIFQTVGEKIAGAVSSFINFLFGSDSDWDGKITVDQDTIDELINSIEETGIDLDDLYLVGDVEDLEGLTEEEIEEKQREALQKYIKIFMKAELATTTPFDGEHGEGRVYIYRASNQESIENAQLLKYISYTDMEKYKNDKNRGKLEKSYSIDESGKLVIPEWTEVGGNISDVTLKTIDYKTQISQYITPMNFYIYLTMVSQNPEFAAAAAKLVDDSKIHLTLLETKNEITTDEIYSYTKNTKGTAVYGGRGSNGQQLVPVNSSESKNEPSSTTKTIITTSLKVTYVKTWFSEQRISYVLDEPNVTTENHEYNASNDSTLVDDPEPANPPEGETVTWITNKEKNVTITTEITSYKKSVEGSDENATDKTQDFIDLMDKEFRIPKTNRKEAAGKNNLKSGAEWLFSLFQKDEKLQNLEQIMRYIMYKYTGKDYGVTEFDFSIFNISEFTSVTGIYGSSIEEKVWFALRDAGYSEYAVAGAMGNIYAESGFNPSVIEAGNGIGFGLCQWSYGRRTQLEAYAAAKGVEPGDVNTQIEFLLTEITPGANGPAFGYATYQMMYYNGYNSSMWENASSPEDAAEAFCWSFERPGIPHMDTRTEKAREYYEMFKGRTKPTGATIVQVADEIHKYMEQNNYSYCVYGCNDLEEWIGGCGLSTTFEASQANKHSCCATYVSWVLQITGHISDSEHKDGATSLSNLLEEKGFTRVSNNELEAGDIMVYYYNSHEPEHIAIYAGDRKVYNAGSGSAIRGASPANEGISCTYGLRAP